jgi:archaellum component FlaD/FlaE
MDIWKQLFGDRDEREMSDTPPDEALAAEDGSSDLDSEAESATGTDDGNERALRDLDVRVDDLETSIERTESSLDAIRSQQSELADDLEEVNDTIRQLLGVYDQLTADANPFDDGDTEGFGVVGGAGQNTDGAHEGAHDEMEDATADGEAAADATDDIVTFADLQGEGDESPDESAGGSDEEFLWEETPEEKPTAQAVPGAETKAANGRTEPADAGRRDAELAAIGESYASDLVVFEWLSELVRAGGPASALQALDYYESVGWISPEVRRDLEDVLSGPHLDVHVDPSRPEELTGDDHVDSYEYVRQLNALSSMGV